MNIKEEAFQFLNNNNVAVISTADFNGKPQGASVYYVMDGDFNFYFVTSKDTKKFENIKNKDDVGIVVGFGPDLITVQGGGKAYEVTDEEDQKDKVARLAKKSEMSDKGHWPVTEISSMEKGFALFKVEPEWLSYMNIEDNGKDDPYEKIV